MIFIRQATFLAASAIFALSSVLGGCATSSFDSYTHDVVQPTVKKRMPALRACYDQHGPKSDGNSSFKIQYVLHPDAENARIDGINIIDKVGISAKMEKCLQKAIQTTQFRAIENGRDTEIEQSVVFKPGEWETSTNVHQGRSF